MKKLISIILLVSLAMGAYAWYDGKTIKSKDVLQINIYENGSDTPVMNYYDQDIAPIEAVLNVINSMKEAETYVPESSDKEFDMDIHTVSGQLYDFTLFIDPLTYETALYDRSSKKHYTADSAYARILLSTDAFMSLYENDTPKVQVTYSTMTLPVQKTASRWSYTLADGTLKDRETQAAFSPTEAMPLSPDYPLSLFFEKEPQSVMLRIYDGEMLVKEEEVTADAFLPYPYNGTLRYELTCTWAQAETNSAHNYTTYAFSGKMHLEPELVFDKTSATAGDLIVIQIKNIMTGQTPILKQSFADNLVVEKTDDGYFGILATDYWAEPGTYDLTLEIKDAVQTAFTKVYPVVIDYKEFKKQYLTVDKTVEASTRNDAAYSEYAKYFTPVRDASIKEKLWEGKFIQPVEGRISTEFGEMRYVNGSLTSYRHSGIDIAAPTGTEIKAPNSGVVKLSMPLILTGETTVIDHGYGIFSVYFHQNERFVSEGQTVEKGDVIGTVGTTGFSTGPHLHWTMSYYDTNVSPWLFIERNLADFE